MRRFFARLAVVPFEAAIAALLIISGVSSLMKFGVVDPFTALLPAWQQHLLSGVSVATGFLMWFGSGLPHKGSEYAGLMLLIAVILSRFLLFGQYLGYGSGFIVTGVFDAAIVCAAVSRLVTLVKDRKIVIVDDVL
jgi:hypothetical protein